MAIRNKLYSYSEAQAAFPFIYDKKEGVLYFAQGKQGAQFVIPINYKTLVSGNLYLLEHNKNITLQGNQGVILSIESGVINIKGKRVSNGDVVLDLKNIYSEKEVQIVNLSEDNLIVTIAPLVPSSVYMLTFTL